MPPLKSLAVFPVLVALAATPARAEFSFTFSWGRIPRCTSGNPNTVGSPRFVLSGVPAGTERIDFHLRDLDAPNYNHGGGCVSVPQNGVVPFGAFTYRSPCPPNGVHTYEWIATARGPRQVLARATARATYP